jgi:outer membrane protein assembly factor BamB
VSELDYQSIAVRNGNVYVGVGRSFRVLDLMTGQQKWGAELPDLLAHESDRIRGRGARVVDPAPAGARGPVWAVAVDGTISAFDRDTGQPLWRETREDMPRFFHPYESGLLLLEHSEMVQLVDPGTRKVLDTVGPRTRRLDTAGRHGLLQVRRWGWRERDGILVHDFMTKKEALFEAVENVEYEVQTVTGHNRVFCATEGGAKLFAGPHGKAVELMPGLQIQSLVMCGPTLMALLVKEHGTNYRRLVGVDPQTLGIRFNLGEWTPEPNDDWTGQVCSNGYVAVAVTSPTSNDRDCELLAVDPAGRVVWKLPVGRWKAHAFLGGHLVVESSKTWQVVRPDTGQVIATYEGGEDWRDM